MSKHLTKHIAIDKLTALANSVATGVDINLIIINVSRDVADHHQLYL